MATWEQTKREGQTAFLLVGNAFSDIHSSIGATYQQILIAGHMYPSMGGDSLTQQIIEDKFRAPEEDIGWFGRQHTYEPRQEPDQGRESEK